MLKESGGKSAKILFETTRKAYTLPDQQQQQQPNTIDNTSNGVSQKQALAELELAKLEEEHSAQFMELQLTKKKLKSVR